MKKKPTIIAYVNNKGGVGKTNAAVATASCLAEFENKATLLIDFDCQANATYILTGDKVINKLPGVVSVVNEPKGYSLADVYQETKYEKLFVIPNEMKKDGDKQSLVRALNKKGIGGHLQLSNILKINEEFIRNFDFIIIDCAPSIESDIVNVLSCADFYLVPSQVGDESIFGIGEIIDFCQQVKEAYNPNLTLLGVLLTMVDKREKKTQLTRQMLQESIEDYLFDVEIPVNTKFKSLASKGMTPIDLGIGARGSKEYRSLTKDIIKRIEEIQSKRVANGKEVRA